jgi:hypothetical protein
MKSRDFSRCALGICVAAMLAGCGGSRPLAGASGILPAAVLSPQTAPPACKGQKKAKDYASVSGTLSKKGGALCIPAFGGFGGTFEYPGVSTSVKVVLTSSTTDYANIPLPVQSGTPLFYLNLVPSAATAFGSKLAAGAGLAGSKIKPKQPYTAYLTGYKYGFWYVITDCYTVAKPSKYGGSLGALGALLKGQEAFGQSGHSNFEIFIYSGQAGGAC